MNNQAKDKTEHEKLTELVGWLHAAIDDPKGWDVEDLMGDAAFSINKLRRMVKATPGLIIQVREAAIIIRETSSPISIIAMDLYERLRKIEAVLAEWVDGDTQAQDEGRAIEEGSSRE